MKLGIIGYDTDKDRIMPPQGFTGKVAIVSAGGAGIGRATASRRAASGAAVVVADLSAANAETTVRAIRDAFTKASVRQMLIQGGGGAVVNIPQSRR